MQGGISKKMITGYKHNVQRLKSTKSRFSISITNLFKQYISQLYESFLKVVPDLKNLEFV